MANLQYVGARYVPKFYENSLDPSSPEWEAGVGYEGMTVVTYLGDSYTSKKPVPGTVGDPAANPEYWAKTGEFNAAILALQGRMTTAENDIDNLEIVTTPLSNMIVIGDSYANPSYGDWPEKLKTRLGLDSSHFRSSWQSGAGFNSTPTGFLAQITSIISGLTAAQKNEVTDVLVGGGLNDNISYESYAAGLITEITNFCDYVKSELPHARIHISWFGYCLDGIGNVSLGNMLHGMMGYKIGAARNGAHYLSGTECALCSSTRNDLTTLFKADGIHPTNEGGNRIVDHVLMGLKDSYASLDSYAYVAPTAVTWGTLVQGGNNGFMMREHDNTLDIAYDGLDFTGSDTITAGQKNAFTFTLPASMYFNMREEICGLCYMIINSTYYTSTYRLEMYHDSATMRVIVPTGGTITQAGFNRGTISVSEFSK